MKFGRTFIPQVPGGSINHPRGQGGAANPSGEGQAKPQGSPPKKCFFLQNLETFKGKVKWSCAPKAEACMEGFGPVILPWR